MATEWTKLPGMRTTALVNAMPLCNTSHRQDDGFENDWRERARFVGRNCAAAAAHYPGTDNRGRRDGDPCRVRSVLAGLLRRLLLLPATAADDAAADTAQAHDIQIQEGCRSEGDRRQAARSSRHRDFDR